MATGSGWMQGEDGRRWLGKKWPLGLLCTFICLPIFVAAQDSSSAEPLIAPIETIQKSPAASAERFGSNVVSYWHGPNYRTPFVTLPGTTKAADIPRNTLEYTHVSFWAMGSNFADIMVNQSSMAEPASGDGLGATEIYATLRSDVSLNEATHSEVLHRGPVRDVSLEVGANLETKNSSYAPAERTIYFGPKLKFAVPKGYFNVGYICARSGTTKECWANRRTTTRTSISNRHG